VTEKRVRGGDEDEQGKTDGEAQDYQHATCGDESRAWEGLHTWDRLVRGEHGWQCVAGLLAEHHLLRVSATKLARRASYVVPPNIVRSSVLLIRVPLSDRLLSRGGPLTLAGIAGARDRLRASQLIAGEEHGTRVTGCKWCSIHVRYIATFMIRRRRRPPSPVRCSRLTQTTHIGLHSDRSVLSWSLYNMSCRVEIAVSDMAQYESVVEKYVYCKDIAASYCCTSSNRQRTFTKSRCTARFHCQLFRAGVYQGDSGRLMTVHRPRFRRLRHLLPGIIGGLPVQQVEEIDCMASSIETSLLTRVERLTIYSFSLVAHALVESI